ncbi:helix-turn-helix transcriptional regulator [Ulvibacterium sp.]|uniref:helix-turn-helix transcriptional regulator n=1 Tax=Ulvibacterium sp. TaxID=2665914 RepID=UPI003BAA24F5
MDTRKQRALQELESLRIFLKGDVSLENGVPILRMDESLGSGQVRCVCFDEGLVAFEFDLRLNQDLTICLNREGQNHVCFLYCLQGSCFHKFKKEAILVPLEELQTAVVSNGVHVISELLIRKDKRLVLNAIGIHRNRYLDKNGWDSPMAELLQSFDTKMGYFHLGKLNLDIAELLKTLEKAKFASTFSSLMHFTGICQIILAKQIEQFKREIIEGELPPISLLKRELQEIKELCDFVGNYPELPHTIGSLCSKSGLSASKLQLGFKFIHGMTIGEYVRDVRLKKAEQLIRTTDMNISEVVYSIGLTSRSYFCKIFKNKYRCSPKKYKTSVFQPLVN